VAILGLGISVPAAAQTNPTLSIEPSSGPIGTIITATVSNCLGGVNNPDGSARLDFAFEGFTPANSVFFVPSPDGTATVTIEAVEKEGQSESLTAAEVNVSQCTNGGFTSVPFTVTRTTPPPPVQPTEVVCANVPGDDRFVDDDGTAFEAVIECMAHSGITAGGPAGLPQDHYGPALVVTRAQMASFIAREIDTANEVETGAGVSELPAFDGTNDFTDVAPGNVHLEAINRLAQAGITGGGPGGRPASQFGPELAVTRAQMASFINRGHGLLIGTALATTANYFADDDASAHEANINGIASEGIAVGDGVSAYGPEADVTRAQMAAFVVRHLAVLEEAGHITPL
jgi:hypothetical protein